MTVEGLDALVKEVWAGIEVCDVDKYIERMDEIVEAVIEANGGHTRF